MRVVRQVVMALRRLLLLRAAITTIGTASWLTFITLNRDTNSEVSHVGYIKFIDVWFLACTTFIFASLFEFALVNVIFRSAKWVVIPRWCKDET